MSGGGSTQYRCFVSNLGPEIDSHALAVAFESCGALDAKVSMNQHTGQGRGFGHVMFRDEETMREAILLMNRTELGGRRITVAEATQAQGVSTKWKNVTGPEPTGLSPAKSGSSSSRKSKGSSSNSLPLGSSTGSSDKSRSSGSNRSLPASSPIGSSASFKSSSSWDWLLRSFRRRDPQEEDCTGGEEGEGPDPSDASNSRRDVERTKSQSGPLERRAIGSARRSAQGDLQRRAMAFGSASTSTSISERTPVASASERTDVARASERTDVASSSEKTDVETSVEMGTREGAPSRGKQKRTTKSGPLLGRQR